MPKIPMLDFRGTYEWTQPGPEAFSLMPSWLTSRLHGPLFLFKRSLVP
jgi:hypothetical protein